MFKRWKFLLTDALLFTNVKVVEKKYLQKKDAVYSVIMGTGHVLSATRLKTILL